VASREASRTQELRVCFKPTTINKDRLSLEDDVRLVEFPLSLLSWVSKIPYNSALRLSLEKYGPFYISRRRATLI
jgi:hypothetical protein